MGGWTLPNVSGSLKRCQRNAKRINSWMCAIKPAAAVFSEQKMTSPQRWRQACRRRWLKDVCRVGSEGWARYTARLSDTQPCKQRTRCHRIAAAACLHFKMEKSQPAAVHTHCSSIPHTATATPLLEDWTRPSCVWCPKHAGEQGFRQLLREGRWPDVTSDLTGHFGFAGDVNPALLTERWLWFGEYVCQCWAAAARMMSTILRQKRL